MTNHSNIARINNGDDGGNDDDDDDVTDNRNCSNITAATKKVYIQVFNTHQTVYYDQTGRFSIVSNQENKLVMMVLFEIDSNNINTEQPLRYSSDAAMTWVSQTL